MGINRFGAGSHLRRITSLRRGGVTLVLSMGLIMSLTMSPATAATIRPGQRCTSIGKTQTVSRVVYKCEKWGPSKVWVLRQAPGYPAFEISYIRTLANRVVRDVATTDCRARDGIGVSGSLQLLANDFDNIANNSLVPPRTNAANYHSRAATLSSFSQQAADNIDFGDPTTGYAQYATVRKETLPLLRMINVSLGTKFVYVTLATC